jgi:hypothetical protein
LLPAHYDIKIGLGAASADIKNYQPFTCTVKAVGEGCRRNLKIAGCQIAVSRVLLALEVGL